MSEVNLDFKALTSLNVLGLGIEDEALHPLTSIVNELARLCRFAQCSYDRTSPVQMLGTKRLERGQLNLQVSVWTF